MSDSTSVPPPVITAACGPDGPCATDESLLAAFRAGDRDAFRMLHARHAPTTHAVARSFFGGDEATARDVVQQVFVKLLTAVDAFRGESRLATWLHRLTVNACLDHRRARRPLVSLDGSPALHAPAADERPDDAALRRERERAVRAAVASLPPKLRIAVLLKHYEDSSYEEMARALDCSPGTVASRLSRGHALLGRKLAALEDPGARP